MKQQKFVLLSTLFLAVLFTLVGCGSGGSGGTTTTYTLTLVASPVNSGIVNLTPGGGVYSNGTSVTLTPLANPEWVFSNWEGNLTGNSNPETVVMDSNKTITAVFVKKKYNLTINVTGNGHVTETVKSQYESGATVSLTAVPDTGWHFDHWEGDLSSSANPQEIVLNTAKVVTAVFVPRSTAPAKWNFLVYLDGDNTLTSCAIFNMNQMEQVGSTADVNILVLLDLGPPTGAKLYLVTKDNNTSTISSQVLVNYGSLDMSNPDNLKNFIVYCQQNYPASHTALTLWDHGGGVWPRNIKSLSVSRNVGVKGICWDDHSPTAFPWNCLTTDQVATTLAAARAITGQKIDIINTDACMIQMLEVAYQWRDQAVYLVGSEAVVPGDGNPYNTVFGHLTTNPGMTPQDFAITLVDDYYTYYSFGIDTTYSVIDLSHMINFMTTFKSFATELNNADNGLMPSISNAHINYVNFGSGGYYVEYIDIGDFCHKIKTNVIGDPNLVAAAGALETSLANLVLHHHETGSYAPANTCYGVSINLPWNTSIWNYYNQPNQYVMLDLSRDTDWYNFILKNVAWGDAHP
jgi:hypothetical protein